MRFEFLQPRNTQIKKRNLTDASQKNYKKIQEGNLALQAFKNILKDQNYRQEDFLG